MIAHFCPVCWRLASRTPHDYICGHFDKARNYCPGSYEPFRITVRTQLGARERAADLENDPENGSERQNGPKRASEKTEIDGPGGENRPLNSENDEISPDMQWVPEPCL